MTMERESYKPCGSGIICALTETGYLPYVSPKTPPRSGLYFGSDKYAAMLDFILSRASSIEVDMSFPLMSATLLTDTTSKGQWRRKRNYYGQSLSGTDFPDRWHVEHIGWVHAE